MEQIIAWTAILAPIIVGFIGWLFNSIITRKLDESKEAQENSEKFRKEDRELFFKRLDDLKLLIENQYVRKDLYHQAMEFHQKETDSKFNNLVESMNKQFQNVEKNIDEVKDLINDKLKANKNGG